MLRLLILPLLLVLLPFSLAAQDCPDLGWARFLDPGPQGYEVQEAAVLDNGDQIMGARFDDLLGEYAKVFLFMRFRGECALEVVSLGSYAMTNMTRDDGEPRIYHLDLYRPGYHATLGMFIEPLGYDDVMAVALDPDATETMSSTGGGD